MKIRQDIPIEFSQNFLSVDKKAAMNSYGEFFKIGDEVEHDGAEDTAYIESFSLDEESEEIKAHTTRGHCHIDFISVIK